MGLLSKLARRGGAFMSGAGDAGRDAMWMNSPIGNSAIGAGLGAVGGAAANPSDPGGGALMGAGIGAAGLGGIQALRTGASAVKGGIERMMQQMPYEGPGFDAAKAQIIETIAGELGNSQVIRNVLAQSRNADELQYMLERVMAPTGEIGAEGQPLAQLGGYAQQFRNRF